MPSLTKIKGAPKKRNPPETLATSPKLNAQLKTKRETSKFHFEFRTILIGERAADDTQAAEWRLTPVYIVFTYVRILRPG